MTLLGLVTATSVALWVVFSVAGALLGPAPHRGEPPGAPKPASTEATAPPVESSSADTSTDSAPSSIVAATPAASSVVPFSASAALAHVQYLAEKIGPRNEGTPAERAGSRYIARKLGRYGYAARIEDFDLPGGRTSSNVIAVKRGLSTSRLLLGAHYDTKGDSPGGNDNASGTGVVLELARVLRASGTQPTVVFVFFGAEEMSDSNPDHHHYGSRTHVDRLPPSQRAGLAGAISVDMVGHGGEFYVRTMGKGPQELSRRLVWFARKKGVPIAYEQDTSRYGNSDHEPFELAGIPAAWLEWREDPAYHTTGDDAAHVSVRDLRVTGSYLQRFIVSLSRPALRTLSAANSN